MVRMGSPVRFRRGLHIGSDQRTRWSVPFLGPFDWPHSGNWPYPLTLSRLRYGPAMTPDRAPSLARSFERRLRAENRSDNVVGLDDVRVDIAMMRTPDGHGRLELTKFHTPTAVSAEPENAPANTLGIRRIMFAVEDIEDVLARLHTHGAELVGELEQYEDSYRLCYVRGPEGIIVALAEQLS
jgi:catechol 2,3-dioxygenase-like lactoylglutathione lyase family enzyme